MHTSRWLAGGAAAVAAGLVAVVQLRDGVVPVFDTASYWSGAEAVAGGRPFTVTLTASFSDVDVRDFLADGGRAWFVDFPVGYPLVAGVLGALIGTRGAMAAVAVVAVAAVGALVAGAGPEPRRRTTLAVRAVAGVAVSAVPAMRLVTSAALSEPLFCALAVGAVAAAWRARRTGRGELLAAGLVGACGLVRFVGAALAVVPAAGARAAGRGRRRTLALLAVGVAPAAVNAVVAGLAGSGHAAGWRGVDRRDLELGARSIAGWLDASRGDLAGAYFPDGPLVPWWGWPVAAVWLAAAVAAVMVLLGARRPSWLPEPLALCLAAAGLLVAATATGMLAFDALVVPDNRVLLPAGVLTITGVAWSLDPRTGRGAAVAAGAVVAWALVAAAPLDVASVPGGGRGPVADGSAPHLQAAAELDADVVLSNDADGVHWHTSTPAAYLPLPTNQLTGEDVDRRAVYDDLPCALAGAGGAVVVVEGALLGDGGASLLDQLVDAGRLAVDRGDGFAVYRPTAAACPARNSHGTE